MTSNHEYHQYSLENGCYDPEFLPAPLEPIPALDTDPITAEWLRSEGLLPGDEGAGELAVKCEGAMPGEHNHVVWCPDGSIALECYDDDGHSQEVISLGTRKTVGEMRMLFRALKCWTVSNWREGITKPESQHAR